jgi:hypothetical protein
LSFDGRLRLRWSVGHHSQRRPFTPSKSFFGDFRGREMAAGVQATGIGDDWKTERAYLNMEAR